MTKLERIYTVMSEEDRARLKAVIRSVEKPEPLKYVMARCCLAWLLAYSSSLFGIVLMLTAPVLLASISPAVMCVQIIVFAMACVLCAFLLLYKGKFERLKDWLYSEAEKWSNKLSER